MTNLTAEPDLHCPLCDYNLRGLAEPRCPECGYGAESWYLLRERIRSTHPYLFEHHPERSFSSLSRTLWKGLIPWRFWRSVQPYHELRLRRLVAYWLLTSLAPLVAAGALYAHAAIQLHRYHAVQRPMWWAGWNAAQNESARTQLIATYGSLQAALDTILPVAPSGQFFVKSFYVCSPLPVIVLLIALASAWPWLVVLVMNVFRTTLRMARIRKVHILRCATYSGDVLLWVGIALTIAAAWICLSPPPLAAMWMFPYTPSYERLKIAVMLLLPTLFLVATIRLAVAIRLYLHLRHGIITALLVQIVVGLLYLFFLGNLFMPAR